MWLRLAEEKIIKGGILNPLKETTIHIQSLQHVCLMCNGTELLTSIYEGHTNTHMSRTTQCEIRIL